MSMFDSYENLNANNIPNNITLEIPTKRIYYTDKPPYEQHNVLGEFIGYSWNYGETLTLKFNIQPVVKVEEDAIVYTVAGESPTSETVGKFNQKAYNTADLKVWVCTTYDQTVYNWEELKEFSYPKYGTKEITLIKEENLTQCKVSINIMNFRREVLFSFEANYDSVVYLTIDKDLSAILLKGIYFCDVTVSDDEKDRFITEYMLIVK